MQQNALRNRIRSLYSIEGFQLPELTAEQQARFLRDPMTYFLSADERQASAIMREIENRQLKTAVHQKRSKARVREQGELLLPIAGNKVDAAAKALPQSSSRSRRAG